MKCLTFEKIFNYLDREVPESEEQEIVAHLLSCRKCFTLARRLEFESAVVAKSLRSVKISRERKDRILQSLAKKRGWKLKKPLFFRYCSFLYLSPKIAVIIAILFSMSFLCYSVLMKDAHIEVNTNLLSLSGSPTVVKIAELLISTPQVIGSKISGLTALTVSILYVYLAAGVLLFSSVVYNILQKLFSYFDFGK